jgi:hypothetical protein
LLYGKDHSPKISGKLKVEAALWHVLACLPHVFGDVSRRGVLEKKIKPLVE